jgi:hypothetical protein
MFMIIGNTLRFAVEFELENDYKGQWLLGKFCYWINGERVGDYDLGTSLRDILFQLETVVRDNGNRFSNSFFTLHSYELFEKLNEALYGNNNYDNIPEEEQWSRFDICPIIDVFNNWKIFMINNSNHARIIYKNISKKRIFEGELDLGEFENVIKESYDKINNMLQIELSKNLK